MNGQKMNKCHIMVNVINCADFFQTLLRNDINKHIIYDVD